MRPYWLILLLPGMLNCGSLAARCGIWPGDRTSGQAEAPSTAFWRRAVVTTSHEKGYAGGHGGGTTFHTMTVKLRLSGGKAADQVLILEKGTLPLTSESEFIYGLISREYQLLFSPDGTKLAISYDGKDYGYIGLDTKSRAVLFHRERRFHPPAGDAFWSAFPPLEDYAVELLADLQHTKVDTFRDKNHKDEPPYFRSIDSSSDDGVIDVTDRFLADYTHNQKIYRAALKGALEVTRQFPVTQPRLAFLRENFPRYVALRPLVHDYLKRDDLAVNALASAVMVLSAAPEKTDLAYMAQGLLRFTAEMQQSDSNYRVYHNWDFNRLLWAVAAHAHRLRSANPQLTTALQRVLQLSKEEMRYDVHPAQVYAIQALTSYGIAPIVRTQKADDSSGSVLPDIWPRTYNDPQRDYCEWKEEYSDCRRFALSAWVEAAKKR